MDEVWIPIIIVPVLFVALPWIILHYVTRWKATSRLTAEDETMLEDLYELARRLDERMMTIERIIQDDTSLAPDRGALRLERPAGEVTTRIGADRLTGEVGARIGADRLTAPDLSKTGRH
jgi:phage shock protein B